MALEIERKFIVKKCYMSEIVKYKYHHIDQVYIAIDNHNGNEVRVRKTWMSNINKDKYELVFKSNNSSQNSGCLIRNEIHMEVPELVFNTYWNMDNSYKISKIRYLMPITLNITAEIDVFKGLDIIIAEVEFKNIEESNKFHPPKCFEKEITHNNKYKNKNLARYGLSSLRRILNITVKN